MGIAVEGLDRQVDAGATDGGRVVDGDALETVVLGDPCGAAIHEALQVGADDRHERLAGGLDGVNDLLVDA